MPHFHIWRTDDDHADSYWVQAASEIEARSLVALNVSEATAATDANKFECGLDNTKQPPFGFIHRRLHGPIAIERR